MRKNTGAAMPSPFPGMDPFIESEWDDFRVRAVVMIADILTPQLCGRYTIRIKRRVYTENTPLPAYKVDSPYENMEHKVVIDDEAGRLNADNIGTDPNSPTIIKCKLPTVERVRAEEHREPYLAIQKLDASDIVTIIELLSPPNKRSGSDGRCEYLKTRDKIIKSKSHLVEIDLLRGGYQMPIRLHTPITADYIALLSRSDRRPKAELIAWSLRHKLPTIPIPLVHGDPDVPLNLQTVFDTLYDRASYDRSLDYTVPLQPPPDNQTQHWITQQLAAKHTSPESPQ